MSRIRTNLPPFLVLAAALLSAHPALAQASNQPIPGIDVVVKKQKPAGSLQTAPSSTGGPGASVAQPATGKGAPSGSKRNAAPDANSALQEVSTTR